MDIKTTIGELEDRVKSHIAPCFEYTPYIVEVRALTVRTDENGAMTWDDIFQLFEMRHNYLLDKLNFDKKVIEENFSSKGIIINKATSNKIVFKVVSLETF